MARTNRNPNECLVIVLCTFLIGISVSLASSSEDISERFTTNNQTAKDTMRINILILTSLTSVISLCGIVGAFTKCHRLIKYFTVLTALNTAFSLFVSIKYVSVGLIVLAMFTVLTFIIALKYEKSLNDRHNANRTNNSDRNNISIITTSNSCHSLYPPQYEPPPAYSDVTVADLPKLVV